MYHHVVIPAILPAAFFLVALSPVEVLGCRNRGLLALLIALLSGLSALGAAIISIRGRMRGKPHTMWWVGSALVLTVPVIAVIMMA